VIPDIETKLVAALGSKSMNLAVTEEQIAEVVPRWTGFTARLRRGADRD
jgi:hypothetical protein